MDPRVDVVDLVAGEAREVQVVAVYCCKVRSSNQKSCTRHQCRQRSGGGTYLAWPS